MGASVDLDVLKKRVQETTICRDLDVAFGSLSRPRRLEKEGARIDDLSRFGHCSLSICRPRRRQEHVKNRRFVDVEFDRFSTSSFGMFFEHCKWTDLAKRCSKSAGMAGLGWLAGLAGWLVKWLRSF